MSEKGNQNGVALKDPQIRQKAYKSFCSHLAKGKSIESWYFEEGEHLCCYKTMQSYIAKFPSEFPSIKKEIAMIKGFQYWESVVEDSAIGKNKDASTPSLQMLMRNKYGWDKQDSSKNSTQYIIRVDHDGIATGISTEKLPDSDNKGSQ